MTPVGALSPIPSTSREVYVRPLNKDLFPEWDMTTTMMMMIEENFGTVASPYRMSFLDKQ
jgi:hypothetical protein